MFAKIYDKLLFVLGLALLVGSYLHFGRIGTDSSSLSVTFTKPKEYAAEAITLPKLEQVVWADATPQKAGPKWIYDLFTPPLIFLDPKTATLSPEPPKVQLSQRARDAIEFPFVLVDITRDLYRIQLAGFFGQAPDYRVSLEDRDTGMPLIGRVGQKWERSRVELKSFNVERRQEDRGGTPIVEEIATAVIIDLETGEEITLVTPGPPRYLPAPKAEFRTRDETPVNFTLKVGEGRKMGDFTYTVRELTIDPKNAVITRDASGDLPEIRRELQPTPKEELPVPVLPTIQGGAPSNAPFVNPSGANDLPPWARPAPGGQRGPNQSPRN